MATHSHTHTIALHKAASIPQILEDSHTHPASAGGAPLPLPKRQPILQPLYTYTCTLCWREFDKPCYTVGSEARIVCIDCWKWMFSMSVCWVCGEIVFRKTDAISFGWCWWHWSCFSCLICNVSPATCYARKQVLTCKVPMRPPQYPEHIDDMQPLGNRLTHPPVCKRCMTSPDSSKKLQQHANILPVSNSNTTAEHSKVDFDTPRVSLYNPLRAENHDAERDPLKPLSSIHHRPKWFHLLPSNRNNHIRPPRQSVLHRRSSFPFFQSTRLSSPFSTPLEWPAALSRYETPELREGSNPAEDQRHCHLPGCYPSSRLSPGSSVSDEDLPLAFLKSPANPFPKPIPTVLPIRSMLDVGEEASSIRAIRIDTAKETEVTRTARTEGLQASGYTASTATTTKRRQSDTADTLPASGMPAKSRKRSSSAAEPLQEPDAARHRPAYFRELSSFFTKRQEKMVLPSRAQDERLGRVRNIGYQKDGSDSKTAFGALPAASIARVGGRGCKAPEQRRLRLGTRVLCKRKIADITAEPYAGQCQGLCVACRACPCRPISRRSTVKDMSGQPATQES